MTPTRIATFLIVGAFALLGLAFLSGCSSPAGRAAKADAAAIRKDAAAANADVGKATEQNERIARGNSAALTDAERIDDKAAVLLQSRWH